MNAYCSFPGFVILPVWMNLACVYSWFGHCFVMISLLKLLGLKPYFHSPSGFVQVLFLTLELIVKAKKRIFILYLNLLKVFIFQDGLNLKLSFLKSKAQVMQSICYTKENINMRLKKVLAPIIDTIITLARLCLPFRGHRDDSKYHPKVGEYWTGGVSNYVEFLEFRVRGEDKCENNVLKTVVKMRVIFQNFHKMIRLVVVGNLLQNLLSER